MKEERSQNEAKIKIKETFKSLEESYLQDLKNEEKCRGNDKEKIYSLLDQTLLILEGAIETE